MASTGPASTGPASTGTAGVSSAAISIVRGEPTADEVAVVVAVLVARSRAAADEPVPVAARTPGWANRARLVRSPILPGPGGWRRSALPR